MPKALEKLQAEGLYDPPFLPKAGDKISREKGALAVPGREGYSYHETGSRCPSGPVQTNLLK